MEECQPNIGVSDTHSPKLDDVVCQFGRRETMNLDVWDAQSTPPALTIAFRIGT